MEAFEDRARRGGATAIEEAERFFMKDDAVHKALRNITARLEELGIPYAVAGGMALVGHGYRRTTVDVDILVTPEGLAAIHQRLEGLGYVPPFAGSKSLRDVETGVRVEFLVAGQFPGDGKPKPVAFPDPSTAAVEIGGIRYLKLNKLIELKLASGLTNPLRLKDLGDVQELIRSIRPPRELAEQLDPSVRQTYLDYWDALQAAPRE
jgi:putative nucleotidyltransferase-like protein